MVQQTHIVLIDDLTGENADKTIAFSYDGTDFEIDLTEHNAEQLEKVLGDYMVAARIIGGRRKTGKKPDAETARIRSWAQAQGLTINARGRIPESVRAAYNAGHAPA